MQGFEEALARIARTEGDLRSKELELAMLQKSKDQELSKAQLMISRKDELIAQKDEELTKTKDDLVVAQQAERDVKAELLASTITNSTGP